MNEGENQAAPARTSRLRPALAALWRPSALIALVALALLGWQWVETRARIGELQQELAGRLAEADTLAKETRALARQGQESLEALQAKVGALDAKLAESQSQQVALEAMYQELTRNRDERVLSEVEQAITTAAQQLQLAGNVEAALIALQGAETRLAGAGRAQFLPLRKVVVRDIERLKALPVADVPGIALKLEGVIGAVDAMPLAFEAKPRAEVPPPAPQPVASLGFWERFGTELWAELKGLVRIERLDRPDPALLAPSHAFFLRENLKLRLVNARLALLQRDGRSFRQDVSQAQVWVERYFDTRAKPVQAALASLKQLAATELALELPTLNESLATLRNFKVPRERDYPSSGPRPAGGADTRPPVRGTVPGASGAGTGASGAGAGAPSGTGAGTPRAGTGTAASPLQPGGAK